MTSRKPGRKAKLGADKAERDKRARVPTTGTSGSDPTNDEETEAGESESDPLEDDGDVEVLAEIVDSETVAPQRPFDRKIKAPATALARFDPLQTYLREIQRHPLLMPEQEHELAIKYAETGDVEAAATLVTSNLRLVVKIAYEYRRAYKNIMDLIQEGNIGLMQAVKRYDPWRGVKVSSYAAWWIRAYILRFVLNNWRLVKLGTTQAQRKLFFNLNKEKARLAAMGVDPTSAEIAKRLNVDEGEVIEMDRRLSAGEASLDAPVGDTDGRPLSRVETLAAPENRPDTLLADDEYHALLRERLQVFRTRLHNEKDMVIFDERLWTSEPRTLQEIGDRFGISRERVRQLEARLTKQLREFLEDELGDVVEAS